MSSIGFGGLRHARLQLPGYRSCLCWAFTLCGTARVMSYLPTMWAVYVSGDSSQHSLWTWLTWLMANMTMAAWLYETNGHRFDKTVAVSTANAGLCLLTTLLIAACRVHVFGPAAAMCSAH